MKLTEESYNHAILVLEHCAKQTGFYASGLPGGYEALWARDSMITSIGASLVDNKFKKTFEKSLKLLSDHQSKLGQIPNCVGDYNFDRKSRITFNTIDSSLWYIIGHYAYKDIYKETKLIKKYKKNIDKAMIWLYYQDPNEDTLLAQQPTMDWLDAFPHKYGHTINTQALYYGTLKMSGQYKLAEHLKKIVNGNIEKYLSLYNKKLGYYLPWNWKNHDNEREEEYWFDTFGNLLAIITGLATKNIANNILGYIEKYQVNKPYPCKSIFPPIKEGDKEWHSYFTKCASGSPFQYSNAGIWPFIGGWYVAALVKMKRYAKAKKELEFLAQANKNGVKLEWEFNEWLDGKTGKPKGSPYQAWNAGSYIFAYHSVKEKKVKIF